LKRAATETREQTDKEANRKGRYTTDTRDWSKDCVPSLTLVPQENLSMLIFSPYTRMNYGSKTKWNYG